jgi:hypothetical protein
MPDVILITGGRPQSFDDCFHGRPGERAIFNVRYVRLDTQVNLDKLLEGKTLADSDDDWHPMLAARSNHGSKHLMSLPRLDQLCQGGFGKDVRPILEEQK